MRTSRTRSKPEPVGQPHVGDDDVGGEGGELPQTLRDGGRLATDVEVVLALEGAGQSLTDQVVVIDEEHAVGLLRHGHALSGVRALAEATLTSTTVPRASSSSVSLLISKVASMREARSRMIEMP